VLQWVSEHRTVAGYPEADAIDPATVLTGPVDVLIPSALEDAITVRNADQIQAQIIIEAANGPITPEADEILLSRGVTVVPDILANAGGVTVSYFEWTQNIQQFQWDLDRVNSELEKKMRKAYVEVAAQAASSKVNLRTAAFILAIKRVARAALTRRHTSMEIPSGLLS
jgi:glutamate dehydrogenase (NAD(P)+)